MPSGRPKDIAFVKPSPMSSGVIWTTRPSMNPTLSQSLLDPPVKISTDTGNKEFSSKIAQDTMNLSLLSTLLDGPFEPAFLADEEGTILHMNPSALQLFKLADKAGFGHSHVSDFLKLFPAHEMSTNSDPKKIAIRLSPEEMDEGPTLSWKKVFEGLETAKYNKYAGAGSKQDCTVFPILVNLIKVKGCVGSSVRHSLELDPNASYVYAYIRDCSADQRIAEPENEVLRQKKELSEVKRELEVTRGIIDISFDAMFITNENGIILMANEAAVKQFGWSREELIGQNVRMICGVIHEKNHDKYMKRYLETGEKRVIEKQRELSAKRKDGTEFTIELGLMELTSSSKQERLFCGSIKDLTMQKAHEKELEQKYNLTRGVVDAAFDAMFAIDANGIILMVNDASTKQFGWSKQEFLGQNVSMIVGLEHAAKHDGYIRKYLESGVRRVMGTQRVLKARRKDGSEFPVWLGLTEVLSNNEENKQCRFVAFVRDLTDKKKLLEMKVMYAKAQELLQNTLPEEYFQCMDR